jgi:hypothetical protein
MSWKRLLVGELSHPRPEVGARAAEVSGDLIAFGDELDDLHREVGEGLSEWPDPVPCGRGQLAVGYLVQHVIVALVDSLHQAADE